jgi:hypothetical protein
MELIQWIFFPCGIYVATSSIFLESFFTLKKGTQHLSSRLLTSVALERQICDIFENYFSRKKPSQAGFTVYLAISRLTLVCILWVDLLCLVHVRVRLSLYNTAEICRKFYSELIYMHESIFHGCSHLIMTP